MSLCSRRKFLGSITAAGTGFCFGIPQVLTGKSYFGNFWPDEPLFDWSPWEKYRNLVRHPCLTIKPVNLEYAHENIRRYKWAGEYASRLERIINRYISLLEPSFLKSMIEDTTPGDPLWTPCPACRDKGKPVHPHGLWSWNINDPEQLKCDICGTVFPDSHYPEDIIIETRWGRPGYLTYFGGEPFEIFGYKSGRPSFRANIRSRKVQWIANYCKTLAEGYLLTGNTGYADACRKILLRFADCYPRWLVHVGYGEYADMDPRIASMYIGNLPEPEICPPPNKPDKSLWTGYWSAGRASGVGLESDFIRKVTSAYDMTFSAKISSGADLYSEDEKLKIEKDLLLESTVLAVCDKKINNKSVSNRTAVALVGMCTGHPGLVRFGLECFENTVNGWFLPDGTSSESPFYGLMTLGGIWDMAQASLGYSDPPGYPVNNSEQRIEKLDLYHNTSYKKVFDAFFRGLQGDLRYPPYADSFRSTCLDVSYIELMVNNYPDRSDYLSLLKEVCGCDLALHSGSEKFSFHDQAAQPDDEPVLSLPYDLIKPAGFSSFSFYYRKPGLENINTPGLKFTDWCPPDLRIAHLRTGSDGRESLLLMNGSHWGNHHENDSLNIYYWKNGYEILSDPGYLWDHPLKIQNMRTVAHNTVVVDEKNQINRDRGGEVLYFNTSENVRFVEMESAAYPEAAIYRRASAIIDHGNGQNYIIDFFRVKGGIVRDYVFHCSDNDYEIYDLELQHADNQKLYDFKNIKTGNSAGTWRVNWKCDGKINCNAWLAGQDNEQVFVADGWGQRDWKNSDSGAVIPYFIRRCSGQDLKTFISVFEGYEGNSPFVRNVKLIDPAGIIMVETAKGSDYIMSMENSGSMIIRPGHKNLMFNGHFAVVSVVNKKILRSVIIPEKVII